MTSDSTRRATSLLLVQTLRRLRVVRLCLRRSRDRYLAVRDALRVAVGLLADSQRELLSVRERYHELLDERRRERQRAA